MAGGLATVVIQNIRSLLEEEQQGGKQEERGGCLN